MNESPPPRKRVLSIRIPEVDILHCYDLLSSAGVDVTGMAMSTAIMSFLDAALNTAEKQGLTIPYETNEEIELSLAAFVSPDKQPGDVVFKMPMDIEQPKVMYSPGVDQPIPEDLNESIDESLTALIEQTKAEVDGDFTAIDTKGGPEEDEEVNREPVEKKPPWSGIKLATMSDIQHSPSFKEVKDLNDPLAVLAFRFVALAMPESMRGTPVAQELFNKVYLTYQNYASEYPNVEIPTEE